MPPRKQKGGVDYVPPVSNADNLMYPFTEGNKKNTYLNPESIEVSDEKSSSPISYGTDRDINLDNISTDWINNVSTNAQKGIELVNRKDVKLRSKKNIAMNRKLSQKKSVQKRSVSKTPRYKQCKNTGYQLCRLYFKDLLGLEIALTETEKDIINTKSELKSKINEFKKLKKIGVDKSTIKEYNEIIKNLKDHLIQLNNQEQKILEGGKKRNSNSLKGCARKAAIGCTIALDEYFSQINNTEPILRKLKNNHASRIMS